MQKISVFTSLNYIMSPPGLQQKNEVEKNSRDEFFFNPAKFFSARDRAVFALKCSEK